MAKFKGIVQIYKEFTVEAADQKTAMDLIKAEVEKAGITDRFNINHPTNIDVKKAKKKAKAEARKAKQQPKEGEQK